MAWNHLKKKKRKLGSHKWTVKNNSYSASWHLVVTVNSILARKYLYNTHTRNTLWMNAFVYLKHKYIHIYKFICIYIHIYMYKNPHPVQQITYIRALGSVSATVYLLLLFVSYGTYLWSDLWLVRWIKDDELCGSSLGSPATRYIYIYNYIVIYIYSSIYLGELYLWSDLWLVRWIKDDELCGSSLGSPAPGI